MKHIGLLLTVAAAASLPLLAQSDFSGTWELSSSKSKNIGMMTQMKLLATIRQTGAELVISNATNFNGQKSTSEIRLDLTGKPAMNKTPMEAEAQTVSKWDGPTLVTTWSSPGSIAGMTSVRTEKRSLSPDKNTLVVQSGRSGSPAMVMVYTRK